MAAPSTSRDYHTSGDVHQCPDSKPTKSQERISIGISSPPKDNVINIEDNLNPSDKKKLNIDIAATLIKEAMHGRNGAFNHSPKQVKLYNLYYTCKANCIVRFFVWLNLALAIFEKPAVSGYELPYWATMILEFACIFVFGLCLVHRWYIAPQDCFRRDKKNIILTVIIIITFVDMLLYVVLAEKGLEPRRGSRILRPVFMVCLEERQVRRALRNIRRTIVGVINVLVLLLLAIGLFALLATKLFQNHRNLKDIDGNPYFQKYFESYYQLYIFTTTANSPDVGIPAYDSNNWFALFFIVFFVLCSYIFLSILLAVVYANYKTYLQNEICLSITNKRRNLRLAFRLISEKLNDDKEVLEFNTWKDLLYKLFPKYSEPEEIEKVEFLWQCLRHKNNENNQNNNYIKMSDFIKVSDLLNKQVIKVKEEDQLPENKCSKIKEKIRKMVCHRYFDHFFNLAIVVNAIFIALSLETAEEVFLILFIIELILNFYTFGWKEFVKNYWNIFDLVLIGGAAIAFIVELSTAAVTASQSAYDFFMILRVLRLIKIARKIERFKIVVDSIIQIGSSFGIWGQIVFLLLYIYAILGMELFQGKIRMLGYPNATANDTAEKFCGDVKLKNSVFYNEHYCGDNFNNILKSMKILFDLMVVNQWHILAQGFVLVTTKAARFYFVSFHIICVILVLNIFVAFILEVFMKQYLASCRKLITRSEPTTEQSHDEKNLEAKEISESGSGSTSEIQMEEGATKKKKKKKKKPKYRLVENQMKTTENLLQQMFEDEIEYEDVGEFEVEEVEEGWDKVTFHKKE